MSTSENSKKIDEFLTVLDNSLLLCYNYEEMSLLGCTMLASARRILLNSIGREGTVAIMEEALKTL